jgi:beta-glucanase (GH16 family)
MPLKTNGTVGSNPSGRSKILWGFLVILASVQPSQGASLLSNPGFESSTMAEMASFPGWRPYGSHVYGETSTTTAHSGTNYLKVYQQFSDATNFTGVFQDYATIPGAVYQADGWAYTLSTDKLSGQNAAWIEVTFRGVHTNVLALYRSSIVTTNSLSTGSFPMNTWISLPVTTEFNPVNYKFLRSAAQLLAPPGTAFLRYQLVFQGDAQGSPGSVFFDDLNLSPAGGAFLGKGHLVWSDEFEQPDGSVPLSANWNYATGAGGWGNRELQHYTTSTNNVRVEDGMLVIEARREIVDGQTNFTSGRLLTKGKHSWTYGRIEARIRIPQGQGIWPAFWMLSTNIDSVRWPACGEIDIMENIGKEPGKVHGTVHGPGYSGDGGIGGAFTLPGNAPFADDFHVFAINCQSNHITWFVDDEPYFEITSASLPSNTRWVFNEPKFILLNLAVGGNWPGYPNASTVFPQRMLVDYVRVYEPDEPPRFDQPDSLRISN